MTSRDRRPWIRTSIAAVLVGLVGVGLAACGNDPRDQAPLLEVAWSSEGAGPEGSAPESWVATEDLWIYRSPDHHAVMAVRLANGKLAWNVTVGRMCDLSEVSPSGMLTILDDGPSQKAAECDRLRLIDTADGSVKWTKTLENTRFVSSSDDAVSVTETTVATTSKCDVDRWSITTGRSLPPLKGYRPTGPRDLRTCADVAIAGAIALIATDKGITGVDIDTGKKRWSRPGAAPSVTNIYSVDPLLAEIKLDGVSGVRQIDPDTGVLGPLIGRPSGGSTFGSRPLGNLTTTDGRAVGSYAGGFELDGTYATAVRGWDLATGREEWNVSGDSEDYLGADERGVYVGRTVAETEAEAGNYQAEGYWLMRWDPASRARKTLGWIKGSGSTPVRVGDLLIAFERSSSATGRLTAYRLPKSAKKLAVPANLNAEKVRWRKRDVRPDPAVDPCTAVSEDTLRMLGFKAALTMPPRRDCSWFESRLGLTVDAEIIAPTEDSYAESLAIERAAEVKKTFETTEEIAGIGDEAWIRREAYVAPGARSAAYLTDVARSASNITLVVRQRNVLVAIDARVASDLTYNSRSYALPWSIDTAEHAVLDVAKDVMKAAGLTLATAAPATVEHDPSLTTDLPDLCAPPAEAATTVIPHAKPEKLDFPGEKRLHGCLWTIRRGGLVLDHVQVVAYAAGPGSLRPTSAPSVATSTFETSRSARVRTVSKAGWDQAAESVDSDSYSQNGHLVVRKGNLVVVVQVGLRHHAEVDQSALMRNIVDEVVAKTG